MKYLVGVILLVVVLISLIVMLNQGVQKESIDLQMKYQEGCRILARNGCNENFNVDGKPFKEIVKELGLDINDVKKECCI